MRLDSLARLRAQRRIARRDDPLRPLSPEMERDLIAAVNEARRQGHRHKPVEVTSDSRGGIEVYVPTIRYIQAPSD